MEHKPRPLKQPILSVPQWVRIAFIGILMSIGTVYLEKVYEATSKELAFTMGFVFFSLCVVVLALSSRSETGSAFNRDIVKNRQQLMLYGISLLMVILPFKLEFLQRFLGLTEITTNQMLLCLGLAFALLLVDEVIKFFMRRRQSK
jgi:Ca2+-transporting ATPase